MEIYYLLKALHLQLRVLTITQELIPLIKKIIIQLGANLVD